MKKLKLISIALLALSCLPASAADLRTRNAPVYKAPPAMIAAPYNWSGFYVGAQVGYQWGDDLNITATNVPGGSGSLGPYPFKTDGVVGGGHAGFNWQTGQWVFGIEGDYEASGVDAHLTLSAYGPDTSVLAFQQKWQASLRGRLGWAFDRSLVYVTGGAAWSKFENTATFDTTAAIGGPLVEPKWSDTRTGFTVGVGIQHAFTQNLSGRIEYRYTDFDSFSHASVAVQPAFVHTNDLTFQTVRVGLSYSFGGGPVARGY